MSVSHFSQNFKMELYFAGWLELSVFFLPSYSSVPMWFSHCNFYFRWSKVKHKKLIRYSSLIFRWIQWAMLSSWSKLPAWIHILFFGFSLQMFANRFLYYFKKPFQLIVLTKTMSNSVVVEMLHSNLSYYCRMFSCALYIASHFPHLVNQPNARLIFCAFVLSQTWTLLLKKKNPYSFIDRMSWPECIYLIT